MPKKPSKEQAIQQLWELGELSWKLKGNQVDVYKSIKHDETDVSCLLISRRFGKSFINCILAVETCFSQSGSIVKYACPQQRMVKTIIKPIMREIFSDCPPNLKPVWHEQDKVYRFPHNGSEIQIAGTDSGNAESLRGGYAHLLICDEAGFMDDLDYVVNNILLPTTDTTNGRLILTSTPNYKDPQHEFHESFVFPMEAEGRLIRYTLDDSPMVTPEKIKQIEKRYAGGRNNPKFRCEYLCEIPKVSDISVIPEFYDGLVVKVMEKPDHFDAYVSMDVGFVDLTVVLFGYYDFLEAKLKILDEFVINGPEMTTDYLAQNIRSYEKMNFFNDYSKLEVKPKLRIMDNDLKLINDLIRLHGLHFIPTKKDNKEAAVNNLRMWINDGRIEIHERCKHLIYHLKHAQWDKNRKKFKHLKDSISGEVRGGHADGLDALIYLVRNLLETSNPFPDNYGKLQGKNVFSSGIRDKRDKAGFTEFVQTIMGIKK